MVPVLTVVCSSGTTAQDLNCGKYVVKYPVPKWSDFAALTRSRLGILFEDGLSGQIPGRD